MSEETKPVEKKGRRRRKKVETRLSPEEREIRRQMLEEHLEKNRPKSNVRSRVVDSCTCHNTTEFHIEGTESEWTRWCMDCMVPMRRKIYQAE